MRFLTPPGPAVILPRMHRKTFAPGDLLFEEGDESQEVSLILGRPEGPHNYTVCVS